jgi:hypothetical protein
MSQKQVLLKHLKRRTISQYEALLVYGIARLASRIDELRQEGWNIETMMKRDDRGKRYARYRLVKA